MPKSFNFEDEQKPFVLMAKIELFIHEEDLKKDVVVERTVSDSWVEPT